MVCSVGESSYNGLPPLAENREIGNLCRNKDVGRDNLRISGQREVTCIQEWHCKDLQKESQQVEQASTLMELSG